MAILAYDDVMLREPRLLVPRMQPLGPVRVDWANPLARDLCFAWIANNPQRDLVKGRAGTGSGSSATVASQYGLARYCTSDAANAGDNFGLGPAITSNSCSVLCFAALVNINKPKFMFSQRHGSAPYTDISLAGNYQGSAAAFGSVQFNFTDTTVYTNTAYAATVINTLDSMPHVLVGTRVASVAPIIYVDGVNLTSSATNNTVSGTYSASQHVRINNLGDFTSTGYANTDPNWLVLAWNRALTAAEVAAISADPYQVFVPA